MFMVSNYSKIGQSAQFLMLPGFECAGKNEVITVFVSQFGSDAELINTENESWKKKKRKGCDGSYTTWVKAWVELTHPVLHRVGLFQKMKSQITADKSHILQPGYVK